MRALGALCLLLLATCWADDRNHRYSENEDVVVWLNKVGPYHNPQETYDYYSLPFCRPKGKVLQKKSASLGVMLEGSELVDSGLIVHFKESRRMVRMCDLEITPDVAETLTQAVKEHYWYQMYIDELPIWGMVGEYMEAIAEDGNRGQKVQEQGFIYTHKDFSIAYNGNQIIEVNLTSENPRPLIVGETHPFTFSVNWVPTTKSFSSRFDRYLDIEFFEHQIHWYSIFNSFMMVVFLCGLVALILLRTLKNDYARYSAEDEEMDLESIDSESGWKQVHGDVFRAPRLLIVYAALIGTGMQIFALGCCAITLSLIGDYYDDRGSASTAFVACYALTAVVAGFGSGKLYKENDGKEWKKCMAITACLFPGIVFVLTVFLNGIAVLYESSSALSFWTMLTMVSIFLVVACPLTLLGTIIGRSIAVPGNNPCRVNAMHRPIPDGNWYTKPLALSLLSGILPFGSIFIELYFILTSFWNYKFYYVYGFLLLVFLMMVAVTVCVTIVSTYFLLNAEDYRWQWTSFFSGGSTALYTFLYAIYYFFYRTRMSGALQTAFYFGYMGVFCLALFVMCGTIGFFGSNLFVRKIYQYIKSD